jgi:serine/threonine-protein kinase
VSQSLSKGSRLGLYEITAAIGAGGMGEVFRARDTTLNRDVAIKVLPAAMATDTERMARFKREAQVLAALNHPNIAHVYGFESATLDDASSVHFLAMELVEGEDLSERLKRGAIAVDEALAIAKQIAEALEEAHEHGVIHRDLKPANVKVTPDGKVKVLDFGLAKALEGDSTTSAANSQASHSPTMSRHATEAGMILGTAAYMSPEQARGKPVDKRADIWSFGVVLFEMLSGTRLFAGETISDTLAAVLKEGVPWARLPGDTPRGVAQLLRRCLARDPRQRMRDIGDARIALARVHDAEADAAASLLTPGAPRPSWLTRFWPFAATALALLGWAAAAVLLSTRARGPAIDLRASLALPESVTIPVVNYVGNSSLATLAISPQGDKVAFVGVKDGQGALYLRRLDRFETARLPNTGSATAPFFSPDGERLGFFARGRLWRIDLPDGVPVDVGPAPKESVGSWGDDGQIVYTPSWTDSLWAIPEGGGESRAFTKIDRAAGESSHRWPCVLPGGAGVLFTIKSASDQTYDEAGIAIADAGTGAHRVLIKGGSKPRYLDDGHMVFVRGGRLYTVAFDLASRSIRGTPAPALEGVTMSGVTGSAWYDVSRAGDLVYLAGTNTSAGARLSWEGPGRAAVVMDSLDSDWVFSPVLSSDLKRAVAMIGGANDKIGLIDLERQNLTRLTSGGGNDNAGVLSKDGRWLIFGSDRAGGGSRFYRMPLDGSAPPAPLFEGKGFLHSISYGAGLLGFSLTSERDGEDAYVMAVAEDGAARGKPILVAGGPNFQGTPMVSPDGKLVTWVSSESGRDEVYVARLGDSASRRRLTNTGGHEPRWNRQGTRIFYITDRAIVSVALRSAADLSFGDPQAVTRPFGADRINGYDIAADGTSVLFSLVNEPLAQSRDIRLWRGWGETVRAVHQ